ncbi:hypothetical protein BT69DRAFT_554285 [Atractiella rhizophila]|nr:hypothetical protein BT69DRAFT_554285 [Atractiella rhizophila]
MAEQYALQSSMSSPGTTGKETLVSQKDDQGTESSALVHLITPVTLGHDTPIHLSILPSFLSRLPPSVHMLRIAFVLPLEFRSKSYGPSKSSYFSLEGLENGVEPDGAVSLCIALARLSCHLLLRRGVVRHEIGAWMQVSDRKDPPTSSSRGQWGSEGRGRRRKEMLSRFSGVN